MPFGRIAGCLVLTLVTRRRRRVGRAAVSLARASVGRSPLGRGPARGAGRAPLHVGLRPEAVSQPRVEAVRERPARADDARASSPSTRRPIRKRSRVGVGDLSRPHGGDFGARVRRDRPRVTPERARRRRLLPAKRSTRAPAGRSAPDRPAARAGPRRPFRRGRRGEDLRRPEHRPARAARGRRSASGPPRQPPPRTTPRRRRLVGAGRPQHPRPADPSVHARRGPAPDPRLRLHPRERVRRQRRGHAPAARPAAERVARSRSSRT